MAKKHRYNTILWLSIVTTLLFVTASFNFLIDPLWSFSHSNSWNNRQPGFNERQQKTNRALFTEALKKCDTLLLGSSRTAYINQYDFKGMRVFNYAADNMIPAEYEEWIEVAKSIKGSDFETIIIGIDFFGTAKNYDNFIINYYNNLTPKDYIERARAPMYRYKSLFSIDALKQSAESIKRIKHPTISDYDRKNVRHCSIKVSPEELKRNIAKDIKEYQWHLKEGYIYRKDWKTLLKRLRMKNPNTNFILFTTPVSKPYFDTFIIDAGHVGEYIRWLRESIEVMDEVYHFMDLNSVTTDLKNFFDAHHLYADITSMIAHRISGAKDDNVPQDFGKLLTLRNLEEYIAGFKESLKTSHKETAGES